MDAEASDGWKCGPIAAAAEGEAPDSPAAGAACIRSECTTVLRKGAPPVGWGWRADFGRLTRAGAMDTSDFGAKAKLAKLKGVKHAVM